MDREMMEDPAEEASESPTTEQEEDANEPDNDNPPVYSTQTSAL